MSFRLHATLDATALAQRFAADRRVRIQPFLIDEDAARLHAHLRAREDWRQVLNSGDKVFELDRRTRAAMSEAQHRSLDESVLNGARDGFQYRYESLRLDDGDTAVRAASGEQGALAGFTRWLSDGVAREVLRRVTGAADILFGDGQATAYSPGDFLTGHDDEVAGKNRRAAYVLGLTPVWRVEWGGLLLFHEPGGAVEGRMPGFNSLDLFAVPQAHSVSLVTASAAYRRYAITGWLRGPRNLRNDREASLRADPHER